VVINLGNDIALGIGLQFNTTTLNQLNQILSTVQNAQNKVNGISNNFNQVSQSIQKTQQVTQQLNQSMNQIAQRVDNIRNSGQKLQNVQENLTKSGKTIVETYKHLDGTLTKIRTQYDQQNNIVNQSVRTHQGLKGALHNIGSTIVHNTKKMLEWAASGTLIYGTMRLIQNAFTTMSNMEVASVNIAKVLPNPNNLSMQELVTPFNEEAIRLAKEYGKSVLDVQEATANWSKQYKEVDDVVNTVRASLLAATATDISFADSVKALSSIMAEWGLETVKSIHVVNILNEMSNNYRLTATELAESLAKTGSAAKVLGLGMEELTGILTTGIQSLGLEGSEVATAWSKIMARMRGNDSAIEAIQKLGIDAMLPLTDIMNQLMIKWDQMSDGEKQNFALVIAGTHHYSKFIGIMDNFNTALEATAKSYFSFNSAQKEIDNVMQTLAKHVEILNASWQEYIYRNNDLLGIQKGIVDGLRYIVVGLSKMPSSLVAISIGVIALGSAFLALRNAFIASNLALGAFTKTLLLNPWTAIITGVAALAVALYNVGKASSAVEDSILQTQIQMEKLTQSIEGNINVVRGINDMSKKYDLLKQAINSTTEGTKAHTNLNQKLTTIQNELAKALGLTTEEFLFQVSKDGSISSFAKRRMEELVKQINLQRQLQWEMQQMQAMQGKPQSLSNLMNFDQVKIAHKAVKDLQKMYKEYGTALVTKQAIDLNSIAKNAGAKDAATRSIIVDILKSVNAASGPFGIGSKYSVSNNRVIRDLENLYNYTSLVEKNAPEMLTLKDILSKSETGGSGKPDTEKPPKDTAVLTEFNRQFLDMIIEAGKKFDEDVNKTISDPAQKLKARNTLLVYPEGNKMQSLQTLMSSEAWSKYSSEANKVLNIQEDLAKMTIKLQEIDEPYREAVEKAQRAGTYNTFRNSEEEIAARQRVTDQLENQMDTLNIYTKDLEKLNTIFGGHQVTTALLAEAEQKRLEILKLQKQYVEQKPPALSGLTGSGVTTTDPEPIIFAKVKPFLNWNKIAIGSINSLGESLKDLGGTTAAVGNLITMAISSIKEDAEGNIDFGASLGGFLQGIIGQMLDGLLGFLTPATHTAGNYVRDRQQNYVNFEQMQNYRNFSGLQSKLTNAEDEYHYWNSLANIQLGLNGNVNKLRDYWADVVKKTQEALEGAEQIREAFGVSINDIAGALENAFQATNYTDFLAAWGQNLEDITRNALVKAFMASSEMNTFYQNLSNKIWNAIVDGNVSSEELSEIQNYSHSMDSAIKSFYDVLNGLGLNNSENSGTSSNSGSGNFVAGTNQPIIYNNYISLHAGAFTGDRTSAETFLYWIRDGLQDIEARA
jgi:TP901 family phage tail tape measure protein